MAGCEKPYSITNVRRHRTGITAAGTVEDSHLTPFWCSFTPPPLDGRATISVANVTKVLIAKSFHAKSLSQPKEKYTRRHLFSFSGQICRCENSPKFSLVYIFSLYILKQTKLYLCRYLYLRIKIALPKYDNRYNRTVDRKSIFLLAARCRVFRRNGK